MIKCQIKTSLNCYKTIPEGLEKYLYGKTCCDWCWHKEKLKKKEVEGKRGVLNLPHQKVRVRF
ncbi:MAG: hypothetical protein EHM47_00785 [Ignavibacteriales bacterium]|nr:MAG: hypothetical protein EHM47_00785 [Ignavibacteriales bacterium]